MHGTIVRDIMTAIDSYNTVDDDASLEEAVKELHRSFHQDDKGIICGQTSALVIDKAGKITGILTMASMLKAIDKALPGLRLTLDGLFSELTLQQGMLAHIPVREAMCPFVKAGVKDDESAGEAVRKLLKREADILPVIHEGKVVGIIRAIDFLKSVGDVLGEKQGAILSFLTVS